MQPEKAVCHSRLPSLATDKVDHREMSALRACPSKSLPSATHTRTCTQLQPLCQRAMGVVRRGGSVREEDGEAGRQTDIDWPGNERVQEVGMETATERWIERETN